MSNAPAQADTPAGSAAPSEIDAVAPGAAPAGEKERRFVVYCILAAVLLAALSGIAGFALARPGEQYVGAVYNIDDTTVYYSWTRQAADGHVFIRNLFTTEPQNPIQFNLLMLALGGIVRIAHVPIPVIFFATRILAAVALLFLIYKLYRLLAPTNAAVRCYSLFLVCLGNGLGWLWWPKWADKNRGDLPVDTWQPEALTFQSIDMSALFTVSLILIVSTILLLVMGQRSGRMRFAVGAGLCALLLGNIHSYDILHVVAAWFVYLVVTGIVEGRFDKQSWLQAVVCGVIALPSPAYQLHMYNVDPAFHQRVHDLTLSLQPQYYALGYGITFLLALFAAVSFIASRFEPARRFVADNRAALLPLCWFGAAIALSYTPHVEFQRKMIMGAHIPLCLLAGCGLTMLVERIKAPNARLALIAACALLSIPTTLLFVARDMRHLLENRSETMLAPYLSGDEIATLQWMRGNTTEDSAFLGFPSFMCFVPGWCDRYTYVSHWGETPKYGEKLAGFAKFVEAGIPLPDRAAYLAATKCDYFVMQNAVNGQTVAAPGGRTISYEDFTRLPQLFQPVYSNQELTVYKILVPHAPK